MVAIPKRNDAKENYDGSSAIENFWGKPVKEAQVAKLEPLLTPKQESSVGSFQKNESTGSWVRVSGFFKPSIKGNTRPNPNISNKVTMQMRIKKSFFFDYISKNLIYNSWFNSSL